MMSRLLMLSMMVLWGAGTALASDDSPAWVAELTRYLDQLENAEGRKETRALVRQAGELVESVRDGSPAAIQGQRELLERAAALRVLPAGMLLGEQLREQGDVPGAFEWFRQAATRGYPPAMIQVGLMYSNGDGVARDLERASSWLRPANVKGSAVGKYLLAECFLYGKGVERKPESAVQLLREAANMQRPGRALDLLATCYHKGWGVIQDSEQAARLYEQACEEGFHNACANLAVLTMTGDGVEQDAPAAVALLRHGVKQENPMCMFFYAAAVLDGLGGVAPDEEEATRWFQKAALAGNDAAAAWCRQHEVELEAP